LGRISLFIKINLERKSNIEGPIVMKNFYCRDFQTQFLIAASFKPNFLLPQVSNPILPRFSNPIFLAVSFKPNFFGGEFQTQLILPRVSSPISYCRKFQTQFCRDFQTQLILPRFSNPISYCRDFQTQFLIAAIFKSN